MKKLKKSELLKAFADRTPITIRTTDFDFLESLEHEDGSGYSFNVKGRVCGVRVSTYVRTIAG